MSAESNDGGNDKTDSQPASSALPTPRPTGPLNAPSSETGPPGPGWWKASDGNWYPPESNPANSRNPGAHVSSTIKSTDERKALLAQALSGQVAQGGRIESQSDFQAVLVFGKPVNHVLQLILTLVTCLLWGLVWLVLVLTGGEKRTMVQVDAYGNVTVQRL